MRLDPIVPAGSKPVSVNAFYSESTKQVYTNGIALTLDEIENLESLPKVL